MVTIEATDINIYSGCSRTMDSDMVLGNSPGLDVIMAVVGIEDHSDQHDPSDNIALKF